MDRLRSRDQRHLATLVTTFALVLGALSGIAAAHPDSSEEIRKGVPVPESRAEQQLAMVSALDRREAMLGLESLGPKTCVDGEAAGYACHRVDLASFVPLPALGGGEGNDSWGWTDPKTQREYAIVGRSSGTSFVDITNPRRPVVIGNLPAHGVASPWRDIKVHKNHAFIVSEASGSGLQIYDMRDLRKRNGIPRTLSESAFYGDFSRAHNIAINETTGYAYVVGANNCAGGLHMVDISTPQDPQFAGCFANDGYTHDVQCVVYDGPDVTYVGRELCFASNEDTLTIVDVTDKAAPVQVARKAYVGYGYVHQGWLTEDHAYFVADDEFDEAARGTKTKTYVWDLSDLDNPAIQFTHVSTTRAIDHNQYVHDDRTYQANYKAGMRILTTDQLESASMAEVAYFDTFPESDGAQFDGAWNVYPFFRANVVVVSTMDRGLFVLGYHDERGNVKISDLDNSAVAIDANRWRAISKAEVSDDAGAPVAGATVTVRWSNGRIKQCVTGSKGRCRTRVTVSQDRGQIGYRVLNVEFGDAGYASWRNSDRDGDSNGLADKVKL